MKGLFRLFGSIPEQAEKAPVLVLIIFLLIFWIMYFEIPRFQSLQDNFVEYSQELEYALDDIPEAVKIKEDFDDEFLDDYLMKTRKFNVIE